MILAEVGTALNREKVEDLPLRLVLAGKLSRTDLLLGLEIE